MIKRVLVALDGSEHASKAIDLGSAIASRFGAELIALHVMPDKPLSDAERAMAEVEFQAEIAQGFDATRLTDAQGNARLMGQRLAEQAAATAARFRRAFGERLIEEAARRDQEVGCLPVIENGALIGMITDRDIVVRGVAEGLGPHRAMVREVMSANAIACSVEDTVEQAHELMAANLIKHLLCWIAARAS